MKIGGIVILLFVFFLCSCFDDKGNYDYREVAEITIENIPDVIEVLGNSDHIIVNPKIVSSLEGEIKADNANFEFSYKLERKSSDGSASSQKWRVLNPDGALDLDTLAAFAANNYLGWFSVTDKRSGIVTSRLFNVKVSSPTYEGWMILCNEGEEERVRMDMISVISTERVVPAYDLLTSLGLPEVKHARGIGFNPTQYSPFDMIFVMSEEGTYKLDKETFETNESWEIGNVDFIISRENEHVVSYTMVNGTDRFGALAVFCVTDVGNAYVQVLTFAGAAFELPINTSERGKEPEYRVSPYVGVSMARPGNGSTALLYDIDNKCFLGWRDGYDADAVQTLTPIVDPENGLFSFKTGMELVYMESTRYSNGLVYAILQDDAGKRCIYGINMSGNGFVQEAMYENLNAPDFDKATSFAFHSQFPYMFYAVGNKVYLHNLGTNVTYPMDNITLGDNEEVTMLKFNLYRQCSLNDLNNQSDEFMARQYELMVGSYNHSAPDNNGGRLGFYPVDGVNNSVTKRTEYEGFARIKDVVYRERR